MAVLSVTIYGSLARDAEGNVMQAGQEPALGQRENMDFGAGVKNSVPFEAPHYVRLVSDANCHVNMGVNAVASTSGDSIALPANVVEYFALTKGSRVSVIGA